MTDTQEPTQAGDAAGASAPLVVLLVTRSAALRGVWSETVPPLGFRLDRANDLCADHLAGGRADLVLVDAPVAARAKGALARALRTHATRCVWTGTARTVARLGDTLLAEAYDVLVTPTTPAVLAQRLAGWARNIQRTAAIEALGGRVESLAKGNERLAARLAEVETQAQALTADHERLEDVLKRIRQVARLSREISSLNLDQIVRVCIEQLPAVVEAQRASLYWYDPVGDRLILQKHSHGYPIAERVDLKDNPRSPMAVAVRRGELLLIREFQEFEQARQVVFDRDYAEQYATRSCIIVPLKGGGRVRGVLNLADKAAGKPFDEDVDLPIIEQIAELIGASTYNVELYQEMERRAKTDPLTGLANRRTLEEALVRETGRSRRYGSPLTVLMIDVDNLKAINDQYGHEAGDAILKNLAATIAETVRSVDVPGRWTGGDEFLLILPGTAAAQAHRLAERLLARAKAMPLIRAGQHLVTGLSIGMAEHRRDEPPEAFLGRVDKALYAAKQGGRDQIVVHENGPAPNA
jgi:diguanylate cyclase (GGDEF)-like protein